ncbi:polyphosphate polymerase domain-containing protein [Micropruina sonneratiae]|uniref:polyphosphate polymerase domain-containing protein n=1 Tax=Micropruina sonneratiae TaxID=2986940 RepID=UPI002227E63E|nr:polyphosphate polymerase domain-containing protein [Micropruina sp. KQZ13P-5]MCW3159156.1 polyphosphate polymerase domain-containing protein [Micropruina sp. KQZ13P-5]
MTATTLALPTIDLDELIARGSLLTRVDRKYALAAGDAAMALDLVDGATTRVLEIGGRTDLGYTSTYLDTPGLDSFLRAARDRRRRYKVRTRRYESNGACFLEVKTRFREHTVKTRLPGQHLHDGRLTAEGAAFVADTLADAGVSGVDVASLTAALRVDYRRITLFHEPSRTRVTVDSGLAWWDVRTGGWLARPELAIIETKSTGRPAGMDRLLWSLGHRPDRISKYATALGAMHPHLPSNKWRPVLKEHF